MTDLTTNWIKKELTELWADLEMAEQGSLAPEGKLSMEMEGIIDRIREATEIVGPVNWGDVGVLTIYSGRYRRYCELVGLPYTYPTEEEFETMVLPYVHEEDRA